jgi:hypothetical protein
MTPPKLKRHFSALKERFERFISPSLSPQNSRDMSSFPFKDASSNDDANYPGLESTTNKRRKKGDEASPLASMEAVFRHEESSKERPIALDGDEDEPDWLVPKGPKFTFRKGLLQSDLRNVDLSKNSKRLPIDGPLLGGNVLPGNKDSKTGGGDAKKAGRGIGNPLFDPLPTSTGIEDTLTSVATYTASNTSGTSNPINISRPRPRPSPPQKAKGKSPGLTPLPGSLPWTSSTPSPDCSPQRTPGRDTPSPLSAASSTYSSDDEKEDLLGNDNLDLPELNAIYTPLLPTRTPPTVPPRNTKPEVIEIDDSSDSETFVGNGNESAVPQVRAGDGVTSTGSPTRIVHPGLDVDNTTDVNAVESSGAACSRASDDEGGVPLTTAESAKELGYVSEAEDEDATESDDEKANSPPNLVDQLVASMQSDSEEEDEEESEDKEPESITVYLLNKANTSQEFTIQIPMDLSYHKLRHHLSDHLSWNGIGTATMRIWAGKVTPRWRNDEENELNGNNMARALTWLQRGLEEGETMYLLVSDCAKEEPGYWSDKDKKINEEFVEDEWVRFKVPRIFGGDRPEGWTGVNGFLLPSKLGG